MASNIPVETRLTECAVCHEEFKHPKLLPCSHSYCLDCIIKLAGSAKRFPCPECRQNTPIPERGPGAFPDNRYAEEIIKVMKITQFEETCPKHKQHLVLFCDNKDCQVRICSACVHVQHKDHNITDVVTKAEEVKGTMREKMTKARDISLLLTRSLTELATSEERVNTEASENLDAIDKFRQTAHEKIQELHNKVQQDTETHKLEVLKIQKSNLHVLRIEKEYTQQVKAQLDGFYVEVEKSVNSLPDSTLVSGAGNVEKLFKELYDQELTDIKFKVVVEEPKYKPADLSKQLLLTDRGELQKPKVEVEPSKELVKDMHDVVPESRKNKRVYATKIFEVDTKLDNCYDMTISSDGSIFVGGQKLGDKSHCLKGMREGQTVWEKNTNKTVNGVCCVLADGKGYLVNSLKEKQIEIRDQTNGEILHSENLEFEAGIICTVEESELLVVNRDVKPRTLVKFKVTTDGGLTLERTNTTINTQVGGINGLTVLKHRGRSLVIVTQWNYPSGVVEATDYKTGKVVWKIEGDFEGEKISPRGVCQDGGGQLYISDYKGDRILVVSGDGTIKQKLLMFPDWVGPVVFGVKQQQLIVKSSKKPSLVVYNINYVRE